MEKLINELENLIDEWHRIDNEHDVPAYGECADSLHDVVMRAKGIIPCREKKA